MLTMPGLFNVENALAAIAALPKSIVKININITDHTFWAGSSLMDYNIEFLVF